LGNVHGITPGGKFTLFQFVTKCVNLGFSQNVERELKREGYTIATSCWSIGGMPMAAYSSDRSDYSTLPKTLQAGLMAPKDF
jgi:hypothetical protein